VVADAKGDNTYQRGRAKEQVFRKYEGTYVLAVCRDETGLERHPL
jgi:hypothetical protein